MTKFWKVFLVVLAVLVVLGLAGLFVLSFFMGGFHMPMYGIPLGGRHMMSPGGYGFWWPTVLRFSLPVLLISLLVLLGVWIGRSSKPTIIQNVSAAPAEPVPQPDPNCAACGRELEQEWIVCPYCGNHR